MRSIADTFTHNVSSVSDKVVCRRRTFEIRRAIANHNDRQLIISLQLAWIETSDLRDRFAFSTRSARWLINIKTAVVAVEVKQQLVREQIVERNVEFTGHWIDQRVETAGDQINFLVLCFQMRNEFSERNKIVYRSLLRRQGLESSRNTNKRSLDFMTRSSFAYHRRVDWEWRQIFVTLQLRIKYLASPVIRDWRRAIFANRTHLMPGDNVLGFWLRNSRICRCVGLMMSSRRLKASWNVIDPPIASLVRLATSWPFPQNSASSSMPSSWITVLSTSKQTISAAWMISLASKTRFVRSAVLEPVTVVVAAVVDPRTSDGIWGMATAVGTPFVDEAIATSPKSDLFKLQLRKMCNISDALTTLLSIFSDLLCNSFFLLPTIFKWNFFFQFKLFRLPTTHFVLFLSLAFFERE